MSTVDLHIHSTISDGTDDWDILVEKIYKSGIKAFSITDHDNFMFVEEIRNTSRRYGLKYVNGIEFSCRTNKLCHILGYNFDRNNADIIRLTERKMEMQKNKNRARIRRLSIQLGVRFSKEDLEWLYSNNRAGKPHIARLLVKNGYARTKQSAFSDYLNKIKVKSENLYPDEAVDAIHKAGGIAVWAHPLGGEGETHLTQEKFAEQFQIVSKAGIDGIECRYSRYDERELDFLTDFALKHGLLISGGSDYHGKNKDISLGELNCFGKEIHPSDLNILEKITGLR